jgi:hypothetical protein
METTNSILIKNIAIKVSEFDIKYVIQKMLFNDKNTNITKKTINNEIKNIFQTKGFIYNGGPTPIEIYVSELMNDKFDKNIYNGLNKQCHNQIDLIYQYLYQQ